ncbi:MAG: tRNA (cytidine(34)-2'-O)-methyltransferase [Cyanobacteria bacterium REEB65]|nr:tRNA (cytidine(34)-2'-O)-methyltransferase [Cyanobacteria bacterium REEB65]
MLHVVLWQPEIPPNTGNVARLAAALNLRLHLVGPLGFVLTDRRVRRAGLDYWDDVDLRRYANPEEFYRAGSPARAWYFSTKAEREFWDVRYQPQDFLVFGSETRGLPADLLEAERDRMVRIPHGPGVRSLNLANCVAIAVYEALRQLRDPGC